MSNEQKPIEASLSSSAVNVLKQAMTTPFTKDWLENMRLAKFNRQMPNCDLGTKFTNEEFEAWKAKTHIVIVSDNVRDLVRRAIKNALEKEVFGPVGEVDEICEALKFEP